MWCIGQALLIFTGAKLPGKPQAKVLCGCQHGPEPLNCTDALGDYMRLNPLAFLSYVVIVGSFLMVSTPAAAVRGKKPQAQDVRLRFESLSHNFGDVTRGEKPKAKFKFTVLGSAPLTISAVHAACGCTVVEAQKNREYLPGESGEIAVTLDTTDFSGVMKKNVTVMTNAAGITDYSIAISAFVKDEFVIEPPLLDFGDVLAKEGSVRIFTIKPAKGFALDVQKFKFNEKAMDVTYQRDNQSFTVNVKLKADLAPGFLKEAIFVKTNSRHLGEVQVPVRANIVGNIELSQRYIEFGAIEPNEMSKRALVLKTLKEIEITGSKAEIVINGSKMADAGQFVRVKSPPSLKGDNQVAIELVNGDKSAQGAVHGRLYLETTDPKQKEITVDFYAFFR